jgi:ABC-type sugar transport system permease subunit
MAGARFFRTIFFMPVILGITIQALMWELFMWPFGGPMESLWGALGMPDSLFLGGQPQEAFAWVIVIQIWANMGITMVIFLAGLQTVPEELHEAARMDGANRWQVFRNVTWPLLTPAVNTNILLNVIGSLQAWQLFLLLIGYRPETQVLGYIIYAEGFAKAGGSMNLGMRQGYAAAASIVLFIIVLVVGVLLQYALRQREKRLT